MNKKPRLFYYEEGVNAFVPVPDKVENIVDVNMLCDKEETEITFKRFNMTDEEMENLPED